MFNKDWGRKLVGACSEATLDRLSSGYRSGRDAVFVQVGIPNRKGSKQTGSDGLTSKQNGAAHGEG